MSHLYMQFGINTIKGLKYGVCANGGFVSIWICVNLVLCKFLFKFGSRVNLGLCKFASQVNLVMSKFGSRVN